MDQDGRFSNKDRKLMKQMTWPPEFSTKVDIKKVSRSRIFYLIFSKRGRNLEFSLKLKHSCHWAFDCLFKKLPLLFTFIRLTWLSLTLGFTEKLLIFWEKKTNSWSTLLSLPWNSPLKEAWIPEKCKLISQVSWPEILVLSWRNYGNSLLMLKIPLMES